VGREREGGRERGRRGRHGRQAGRGLPDTGRHPCRWKRKEAASAGSESDCSDLDKDRPSSGVKRSMLLKLARWVRVQKRLLLSEKGLRPRLFWWFIASLFFFLGLVAHFEPSRRNPHRTSRGLHSLSSSSLLLRSPSVPARPQASANPTPPLRIHPGFRPCRCSMGS